ncbi:electron transport complex subunit RsxD [Alteromonas sp. C1M14]|uniref:electron transport complex subunit RsxD n=1 Tax=Alteromonas sp. C1M14 TaxID=2841567 RepID=UPI001C0828BA|nr:electron transport complex subunit RsxD [Alteromonas sp. C1M14]MBU2978086.1 electron transport complex subunit RsxD [Alteromonas sp. C1M14]
MKLTLSSSPHMRADRDTSQVMRMVLYAMVPGVICQSYFFGWGVFIQIAIATIAALVVEASILAIRNKPVARNLSDYSAVLTACLLAVSLPPALPWWMTVIGVIFAIGIVKQLYGGLGYNLFNPAMVAYVVLLISFPAAMTQWIPPAPLHAVTLTFSDMLHLIFTGYTPSGLSLEQGLQAVDGVSSATPLDHLKTGLTQASTYNELLTSQVYEGGPFVSSGTGWAWVSVSYLIGGLFLLKTRIISWHIPVSLIVSIAFCATVLHLINQDIYGSALFHLLNGSVLFGAFFIATDPVSASTTAKGRIIFGAMIGFWIIIIRNFGGYPDAVAFAVIIMNMAVPLIDYYTQPRTYGHKGK